MQADELYAQRFAFASQLSDDLLGAYEAQRPESPSRQAYEGDYEKKGYEKERLITEAIHDLEQIDIALRGPDPDTPVTSPKGLEDLKKYTHHTLGVLQTARSVLFAIRDGRAPLSNEAVRDTHIKLLEYYRSVPLLKPTILEKLARYVTDRGFFHYE